MTPRLVPVTDLNGAVALIDADRVIQVVAATRFTKVYLRTGGSEVVTIGVLESVDAVGRMLGPPATSAAGQDARGSATLVRDPLHYAAMVRTVQAAALRKQDVNLMAETAESILDSILAAVEVSS